VLEESIEVFEQLGGQLDASHWSPLAL
jgi:hypothetical protein